MDDITGKRLGNSVADLANGLAAVRPQLEHIAHSDGRRSIRAELVKVLGVNVDVAFGAQVIGALIGEWIPSGLKIHDTLAVIESLRAVGLVPEYVAPIQIPDCPAPFGGEAAYQMFIRRMRIAIMEIFFDLNRAYADGRTERHDIDRDFATAVSAAKFLAEISHQMLAGLAPQIG